jgi:hypothetical protein
VCVVNASQHLLSMVPPGTTQSAQALDSVSTPHTRVLGACRFLYNHPVPVVVGPGGRHYLIDHHHLARAMHNQGITTCYAGGKELCKIPYEVGVKLTVADASTWIP